MKGNDKRKTFWFGQAFHESEIIGQKYNALGFWANMLTIGIVILFIVSIIASATGHGEGWWIILGIAIVVRFIMAVAKLYYEEVYDIRK